MAELFDELRDIVEQIDQVDATELIPILPQIAELCNAQAFNLFKTGNLTRLIQMLRDKNPRKPPRMHWYLTVTDLTRIQCSACAKLIMEQTHG